ncbi:MAG: BBP7 family outer membrane beta-barrel protein [Gemmataceae bacterium]|nr:BBP7 family outer membrane beta-barrel protein [Gemmataceae bacterium]
MRLSLAFLGAWTVGTATALAQTPESADPVAPPSSPTAAPGRPAIDLPPCAPEAGGFYAEVELLLRWFKPVCASVPVVSIGDPQAPVPGALGQPGTRVVVGGVPPHKFEFPMTPGVQLTAGWDRGDGAVGLVASGFIMEQATNSQQFTAIADGFPYTYLPYQAPDNSYRALPFTVPGVVTGSSVAVGSTKLWGVEGDLAVPFALPRDGYTLYGTFLVGGRYLDLTDRVRVTNTLRLVADPSAFAVGADEFRTHNRFAGPLVGTTLGVRRDWCAVELTTKYAAGWTDQLRVIEGSPLAGGSVVSPQLVPGPFLALPSNVGRQSASRVTLVPEIAVKTRVAVTSWCSVSFGYSLLYWNKVLCPGDQMSPLVNITQLPGRGPVSGPLDPKPPFNHTDYFAQGMSFGIQCRY